MAAISRGDTASNESQAKLFLLRRVFRIAGAISLRRPAGHKDNDKRNDRRPTEDTSNHIVSGQRRPDASPKKNYRDNKAKPLSEPIARSHLARIFYLAVEKLSLKLATMNCFPFGQSHDAFRKRTVNLSECTHHFRRRKRSGTHRILSRAPLEYLA